jgi:bifunctional non-homologous end joining protein LigD
MSLRPRALPAGFIAPCLPTFAPQPPSGDGWQHEIKHDGFRVVARKKGQRVKLYSRPGNDLTPRFPLIVEALARLPSRSCVLDGEAVACGEDGIALFERIRYRRHDPSVFLYAFDLIELDSDDLRREPLERRKAALERLLARAGSGVQLNEHLEAEGPLVFEHACRMGLEGIVSKRKGSWYSSGRSRDWLKATAATCSSTASPGAAITARHSTATGCQTTRPCVLFAPGWSAHAAGYVRPDWGPHVNKRRV